MARLRKRTAGVSEEAFLLESKAQSRQSIPALRQKSFALHQSLLQRIGEVDLLPKRFLITLRGYSLVTYFVVWSLPLRISPHPGVPKQRWCLGLRIEKELDSVEVGQLEFFYGVFGADGRIEQGIMPEPLSLERVIDWLWESPWFTSHCLQMDTPEACLGRQLDYWQGLISRIPVTS